MREHFYLITEHPDSELVGKVQIQDKKLSRPEKNEEGPLTEFNENTEEFIDVGKLVGLGHHDFDSEPSDHEYAVVIEQKLEQVDEEWIDKAGLDL